MSLLEYRDIVFNIKSFLDNRDIIELILSSKKILKTIGNKNIFTSITIHRDSNICDMIRYYIKNKVSIIKTVIIDSKNPFDIWPFCSEVMIFINCGIKQDYVDKNYKNCKNKIIKYKYQTYQHFWP